MTDMAHMGPSAFSRRFSAALKGYVTEQGIQQKDLAEAMDRSTGYISEHLGGKKPVNTDMLDAIAEYAGVDSRDLVIEVARRMADQKTRADAADADNVVALPRPLATKAARSSAKRGPRGPRVQEPD